MAKAGVSLDYFFIEGKGLSGYATAAGRLRRRLKSDAYDLIHAHYGLCAWVAYLAIRKRIPLVVSYMGSDISAPGPLSRFNRMLHHRVDHVIVKSGNLRSLLHKKQGVSVIANGVNLDLFMPMDKDTCRIKLGLDLDRKLVLFLGDPHDRNKNRPLLEKAIRIIDDSDIILLQPYGLEHTQVPLYLGAADVLVLSSISEGSPNVIKEAMACNCPIVATDVGDVRLVLGDTPGCFISGFSPEDMAQKLKLAMAFGGKTGGRERILQLGLDGVSSGDKIMSVYREVLNGKM